MTYFSLKAPPTPVPLVEMLTVASSKPHEDAAARLAPSDSSGNTIELANLILAIDWYGCDAASSYA